jgi:WbqC-like protein
MRDTRFAAARAPVSGSEIYMTAPPAPSETKREPVTRTVVIEQPNYIPWCGYFDLVRQSDVWVWYDDVQYTKRDWRNRNRVAGDVAEWLTIPVKTKGRFAQRICDVEIDDSQPWRRRHLETIRRCYARAPFFEPMFALIQSSLASDFTCLADLTIHINEAICSLIGFSPSFLRSSQLQRTGSSGEKRLIETCRCVGGDVYLSGPAARAYIDPRAFAAAGIELRYIVYDYPPYARGSKPFVPNLSIIDMLAWLGPRGTDEYLAAQGHFEAVPC